MHTEKTQENHATLIFDRLPWNSVMF